MNAKQREEMLVDILTRAIPALSVAVDLAKSPASKEKRRELLREAECAVGPAKVNELVSSNHGQVPLTWDPDGGLPETLLVLRGAAKMLGLNPDEHPADIARKLEVMATAHARITASKDDCSNPDCEDGIVFDGHCSLCQHPIGRTCPDCGGAS